MPKMLFQVKTQEAHTIKLLSELFQSNLKTGCFEVDEYGIKLRMMDPLRKVLFDVELKAENFSLYKFKGPKKIFLGLNHNHFHKMLKSIKKKDSLVLFIDEKDSSELGIKVLPKDNNRVTTSHIKIQNIQNIDIDVPTGYDKPVIVPSNEYQKMAKELANIATTTRVYSHGFFIKFSCNAGAVYKREVVFGETAEDEEQDDDDDYVEEPTYDDEFDTEQLTRILKIAGLSNNMQIFPKQGLPLLFRSNVGSLGKISIYVKSKSQIEDEQLKNIDSGDDEHE